MNDATHEFINGFIYCVQETVNTTSEQNLRAFGDCGTPL